VKTKKDLTRRGFIKGVAVAGLGAVVASCAPATQAEAPVVVPTTAPTKDKIVVGMARPLSGWNAKIGDSAYRPVYETFIAEVNKDGGVFIPEYGKKLPIETIIYDDKSDVATMTQLTEKLIVDDKVDFLWPASGTSFLFAQAPIANKYGYVLITAEGGASSLKDMLPSMPYVFVTLSFSDWYQVPVYADLMAAKGAKTAFITYIADLHGIEYSGVAGIEFPKRGIEVVGVKSLPPDIKDLNPVIKEAKASNADVFCCFAYPDQIFPAIGASAALGFNPKSWIGGPGVNFGFFHTAFGPLVEGVTGWTSFSPKQSPEAKELADKLWGGKPEDVQDPWGHPLYWAGLQIWKQAVEKVGLDQTKLRDYIIANKFPTVLGETWFEKGLLSKDCHTGEVGQWVNGVYEVVGPTKNATAELVYPKPEWPKA
jgi:branched-chain amino acid transport system substrate-binding protein